MHQQLYEREQLVTQREETQQCYYRVYVTETLGSAVDTTRELEVLDGVLEIAKVSAATLVCVVPTVLVTVGVVGGSETTVSDNC